jgi:hypothetical protein
MGVLASFFGEDVPELVEHNGKQYYKNVDNPSFYFPDEKTLVVATTSVLPSMMSSRDVDSPLVQQLKTTDVAYDVVLVSVTEPFQEQMKKVLEAGGLPPPLDDVAVTLLFNAEAMVVSVDITGDLLCRIKLLGQDDVGARNLDAFVRAWFESGRQMFADTKGGMAAEMPFDLGDPLVELGEQIIPRIRIEKQGLEIRVDLDRPPVLDRLPELLRPAINALGEQARNDRPNE